jgi:hypothetical protein
MGGMRSHGVRDHARDHGGAELIIAVAAMN